jgi:IclR family transcriptional regulator, pca regulon regulatory protein
MSTHISPNAEPRFSRSLEYGVAMLECFTAEKPVLRISELADMIGISRSTTHRYATTLLELGYLEQDRKRRYRLTRKAGQAGMVVIDTIRRSHPARAILEDLRAQTGHTVSLGMLDGEHAVYIHRLSAHAAGQYDADGDLAVGAHVSVYDTALGKALLSTLLDSELQSLLPVLEFRDELSPTRIDGYDTHEIETELQIAAEIERVTEDGIATCETVDARSIAVPLTRWLDKPILAVELTVPASTHTMKELLARFGEPLKHAAKQISV